MKRASAVLLGPIMLALLYGCGSSGKSTTAASQPATASNQSSYAPPATGSTSTAAQAALITTKHGKLGTILAYGPNRLTVYLFEADKAGASSCSGECASVWPPVTGHPQASGAAVSSRLGTLTRADGTVQVTYNGHPLYRYATDKGNGDMFGQGLKSFGAGWYVLAPSGKKVDRS